MKFSKIFKITDFCYTAGGDIDQVELCEHDDYGRVEFRQDFSQRRWTVLDFQTPEEAFNFFIEYYKKANSEEALDYSYRLYEENWHGGTMPVFKIYKKDDDGERYCVANIIPTKWNGVYT